MIESGNADADKLTSGKAAAPSGEDGEKLLSTSVRACCFVVIVYVCIECVIVLVEYIDNVLYILSIKMIRYKLVCLCLFSLLASLVLQEAVKMIREMLKRAAERPASETNSDSGESELDKPLEDSNLDSATESAIINEETDSAEDKVTPSAPSAEVSEHESSATSQRTRTLPNGLTVTVHPTDEISASLGETLPTIVSAGELHCCFVCTVYDIFYLFTFTRHKCSLLGDPFSREYLITTQFNTSICTPHTTSLYCSQMRTR